MRKLHDAGSFCRRHRAVYASGPRPGGKHPVFAVGNRYTGSDAVCRSGSFFRCPAGRHDRAEGAPFTVLNPCQQKDLIARPAQPVDVRYTSRRAGRRKISAARPFSNERPLLIQRGPAAGREITVGQNRRLAPAIRFEQRRRNPGRQQRFLL